MNPTVVMEDFMARTCLCGHPRSAHVLSNDPTGKGETQAGACSATKPAMGLMGVAEPCKCGMFHAADDGRYLRMTLDDWTALRACMTTMERILQGSKRE
jgi:hypothetical protein